MAEAVLICGKRGSGKSLGALHMMEKYAREGRLIATNMDIRLDKLTSKNSKVHALRLPDHPSAEILEAMPMGNPVPTQEERNGLLVLDEVATFLNSRDWQAKDRQALISWLVQSRKYGWDLLLIAQHPRLLDAQIRDSLVELQATARRLDKIRVPVLGGIWKAMTGKPLKFPKIHIVTLFYGFQQGAPMADRWVFRGSGLWDAYDSLQKINPETGNKHLYTMLSHWHLKGRYLSKWEQMKGYIFLSAGLSLAVGFGAGYMVGGKPAKVAPPPVVETVDKEFRVVGTLEDGALMRVILNDGRVRPVMQFKADASGARYLVDGKWHTK